MEKVVLLGGGFKYFLFSPLLGEDFHFDQYFSKRLEPPTSLVIILVILVGIGMGKRGAFFPKPIVKGMSRACFHTLRSKG